MAKRNKTTCNKINGFEVSDLIGLSSDLGILLDTVIKHAKACESGDWLELLYKLAVLEGALI